MMPGDIPPTRPSSRWQRLTLACPICHDPLQGEQQFSCRRCGHEFPVVAGVPRFRQTHDAVAESQYLEGWQGQLRRRPQLYSWIFKLFAPVLVTGPNPVVTVRDALQRGVVIDIGGGNDRWHPEFVNVDILPYPEVDIVADAGSLPLAAGSIAGIVSIAVLEHVPRPDLLIAEATRVLGNGGTLFLVVPFLQPFHAAPHDYRRWTRVGLVEELERHQDFEILGSGVYCGPASALTWMLAEFGSQVLSLGSGRLKKVVSPLLQVLFSPLKWLDWILARTPQAEQGASAVYVTARRRASEARAPGSTPVLSAGASEG